MNPATTFIYGLLDPRTQQLRYVGKANKPFARHRDHLTDAAHTHKTCWIRSLKKIGIEPEIIILEEVPRKNWEEFERWWIAYARSLGADLTNATGGGEGLREPSAATLAKMIGHPVSEETKEKLRQKALGRPSARKGMKCSPETVEKIRNSRPGFKHSEETKQLMSKNRKGRKHSEETKEKIRQWNVERGNNYQISAEGRAKMSAAGSAHRGCKRSGEALANLQAGSRKRWGNKNGVGDSDE